MEAVEKRAKAGGLSTGCNGRKKGDENIYVNGDAIEALPGLSTPLKDGDEVTIIPVMAGGGG